MEREHVDRSPLSPLAVGDLGRRQPALELEQADDGRGDPGVVLVAKPVDLRAPPSDADYDLGADGTRNAPQGRDGDVLERTELEQGDELLAQAGAAATSTWRRRSRTRIERSRRPSAMSSTDASIVTGT